MKKIMFNDKFGLTEAVLEGRKTMTRRIVPGKLQEHLNACGNPVLVVPVECIPQGMTIEEFAQAWNRDAGKLRAMPLGQDARIQFIDQRKELIKNAVRYKVGEVVAVAQSLRDMGYDPRDTKHKSGAIWGLDHTPAWTNKMFVSASECIHQLRITNVRVERLQDISDEDCIREGIEEDSPYYWVPVNKSLPNWRKIVEGGSDMYPNDRDGKVYPHFWDSPRKAFAALIDRIFGKGTWERNPWVFVYEFELVK